MNSRTLLNTPYHVARVPLSVLDATIGQRLAADSAPSILLDKAIGSFDQLAGRIFFDDAIAQRGTDRIERASKLSQAAALDQEAAQKRDAATAADARGKQQAREKAQQAKQRAQEGQAEADEPNAKAPSRLPPTPALSRPRRRSRPWPASSSGSMRSSRGSSTPRRTPTPSSPKPSSPRRPSWTTLHRPARLLPRTGSRPTSSVSSQTLNGKPAPSPNQSRVLHRT